MFQDIILFISLFLFLGTRKKTRQRVKRTEIKTNNYLSQRSNNIIPILSLWLATFSLLLLIIVVLFKKFILLFYFSFYSFILLSSGVSDIMKKSLSPRICKYSTPLFAVKSIIIFTLHWCMRKYCNRGEKIGVSTQYY